MPESFSAKRFQSIRPYLAFGISICVIYLTLPLTPTVVKAYKQLVGTAFEPSIWVFVGAAIAGLMFWIVPRARKLSGTRLMFAVFAFVEFVPLLYAAPFPIEKVHVTEYALLPFFAFAVAERIAKKRYHYWATFALAGGAGIVEECIQGLLPMRHFDWHDIALNVAGAAIGTQLRYSISPATKA